MAPNKGSLRVVNGSKEESKQELTDLTWKEALELGRADFKALGDLETRARRKLCSIRPDDQLSVAQFFALEIDPNFDRYHIEHADHESVLKALKNLDHVDLGRALRSFEWRDYIFLQRVIDDKATGKLMFDRGMHVEAARILPDGTVVKSFHNYFKDKKKFKTALRGQNYHCSLVDFSRGLIGSLDELKGLKRRMNYLRGIKPASLGRRWIDDVYIGVEDLRDKFEGNISLEDRTRIVEDVVMIDLGLAYSSQEFKRSAKGKKLHKFDILDDKKDLIEKILLKSDTALSGILAADRITTADGTIRNKKKFYERLEGRYDGIAELLGFVEGPKAFCGGDLNLGNVMINGNYYFRDFEESCEMSLAAMYVARIANAGILNWNGESLTELGIRENVVETIKSLDAQRPTDLWKGEEAFEKEVEFQKNKFLLRLARRFKVYSEMNNGDPTHRMYSKFFYSVLRRKIDNNESRALRTLDDIFLAPEEKPFTDTELDDIHKLHNPFNGRQRKIHPISKDSLLEMNAKKKRRARRIKRGVGLGTLLLTVGALSLGAWHYKDSNRRINNYHYDKIRSRLTSTVYSNASVVIDYKKIFNPKNHDYRTLTIKTLAESLGDHQTAFAFFIGHLNYEGVNPVWEAMRETDSKVYNDEVEDYLKNNGYATIVHSLAHTQDRFHYYSSPILDRTTFAKGQAKEMLKKAEDAYQKRKSEGKLSCPILLSPPDLENYDPDFFRTPWDIR
jgi:hypothetical protein